MLERMRIWHALPDGWHAMTYGAFLAARRRILAEVIRAGLERLRDGTDDDEQLVPIADFVAAGENDVVEFKSRGRYNPHTQRRTPRSSSRSSRPSQRSRTPRAAHSSSQSPPTASPSASRTT
ncbi:MAG: hypothetical protein WKF67_01405 [Rubrobacteraceae bacterium]